MQPRHPFLSALLFQLRGTARGNLAVPKTPSATHSIAFNRAFRSSAPHTSILQRRVNFPQWKQAHGTRSGTILSNLYRPQQTFRRFFQSSRARHAAQSPKSGASLSQRLRNLSKEYGWSALWVYLLLSAMDFPICFAAVRLLGVERIGYYEHVIFESVKGAVDAVWPNKQGANADSEQNKSLTTDTDSQESAAQAQGNGENASLWTQLALAYAIHKSLIFIRVPLTAAITPKVVKTLRQWGYNIVKGRPRGM
ncbi:hypothetical protein BO86DRAFT_387160 [Aspergillus japonicus CBS 114.51]|uniref:DUF1279 domain-containing protein n=2 Tax=Aspergillus TaxID=5052 RepID=A0A2V5HXC2_ASPV1|nr:hypothetical protein BO86DRAFT_387160 [Aspergillus japonicus CBS 114.51]PYI20920.1 hypothetical protein BO99DRAFT_401394 [Aspergillus violaceofuscus CBS 115571]RAH84054.1 hypothetical protein BO86DRAFT_387160 [Aspergillus japonicus CBS 114.51]